jgi:hypothetical protein
MANTSIAPVAANYVWFKVLDCWIVRVRSGQHNGAESVPVGQKGSKVTLGKSIGCWGRLFWPAGKKPSDPALAQRVEVLALLNDERLCLYGE